MSQKKQSLPQPCRKWCHLQTTSVSRLGLELSPLRTLNSMLLYAITAPEVPNKIGISLIFVEGSKPGYAAEYYMNILIQLFETLLFLLN